MKTVNEIERVLSEGAEYRRQVATSQMHSTDSEPVDTMRLGWRSVGKLLFWMVVWVLSLWFGIYMSTHGYPFPLG